MGKSYNRSTGYRSRKRKFYGKQRKADAAENISASAKKLKCDTSHCDSEMTDTFFGYRIIDVSVLFSSLSEYLSCKTCKSSISFSEKSVRGAASMFEIHCECSNQSTINSCEMLGEKKIFQM